MILFLQLSTLHHAGHIEYLPDQGDGDRVPRWRPFEGPKYFHGPAFVAAMAPYLASTEIVVTDWGVRWPEIVLLPELPVAACSAKPAPAEASLDGRTFAPIPLKRRVTLPTGEVQEQEVPPSEYRALRWQAGDLAPGSRTAIAARTRILPAN